jgi:hypothetical protein
MPPRRRPTTRLLTSAGWAGTIGLGIAIAALALTIVFQLL